MGILSIQSYVITGHVGNAAACLPLQLLGFDVWTLNTVVLSNHPAVRPPKSQINNPQKILDFFDGICELGLLVECEAVLGGYLENAANGAAMVEIAAKVKQFNKRALFICDPVMGDNDRIYVKGDIVNFYKNNAIGLADVILPNAFEAYLLTGVEVTDIESAIKAIEIMKNYGPKIVIISGVNIPNTEKLATLMSFENEVWLTMAPKVAAPSQGAGDLLSALFTGHYLKNENPKDSFNLAVAGVHAALVYAKMISHEFLPLVSAQSSIINPPKIFSTKRIK